jgi:hypothetical protein
MGDQLKDISRRLLPKVVVLDAGSHPKNIHEMLGAGMLMLQVLDGEHFLESDWSVVSERRPKQSKTELLRLKKVNDAEELSKLKKEDAEQHSVESEKKDGIDLPLSQVGQSIGSSSAGATVYYRDPLENTDVCESGNERAIRVTGWTWYVDALRNHAGIVNAVRPYDIHALVKMVKVSCIGEDSVRVLNNIRDMVKLSKLPGQPFAPFCSEVTRLMAEMGRVTDDRYKIGPGVLPAFVLRAIEDDEAYQVDVAFLRRQGANLDKIIHDLSQKAVTVESGVAKVTGLQVSLGKGAGYGSGVSKGPCYNWRDNGACKFGEACRFSHAGASSVVPKASSTAPAASRAACLECGSNRHGYRDCDRRKMRQKDQKEAVEGLRAELKALKAELVEVRAAPAASPRGGNLADLDPFAVHDVDAELATIWAGRDGSRN